MSRIIAADIGGTNARFALFDHDRLTFRWSCSSREYREFYTAFDAFLKEAGLESAKDHTVCLAVAGIIQDNTRASGTNIPWVIECGRIRERGCRECVIINDFEAAAWGITVISADRFIQIGGEAPVANGTRAILGAGTGLGEAIIPTGPDGRPFVIPSEGGHCGFAPETREEAELLSWLMQRFSHVSVERLLSGQGLVNIYKFLKGEPSEEIPDGTSHDRIAPEITGRALAGTDPLSTRAVELFCQIYGSEAGNLALKCLPAGGVFVAGGIAPAILPFLQEGGFRRAFEHKGCMKELMQKIPLFVVKEPDLGLIGAAARAVAPLSR